MRLCVSILSLFITVSSASAQTVLFTPPECETFAETWLAKCLAVQSFSASCRQIPESSSFEDTVERQSILQVVNDKMNETSYTATQRAEIKSLLESQMAALITKRSSLLEEIEEQEVALDAALGGHHQQASNEQTTLDNVEVLLTALEESVPRLEGETKSVVGLVDAGELSLGAIPQVLEASSSKIQTLLSRL